MSYTKPALTIEKQAALLLDRGLEADKVELESFLSQVNYYRFSGYLYPFKKPGQESFQEGTTLYALKDRYDLDRKLRLLLMDSIERIEISILRSHLVEQFSLKYGAFGFTQRENYKDKEHSPEDFHQKLVEFSKATLLDTQTDFILRYRQNYPDEEHLPFWILVEKMTFGHLSLFVGNLSRDDRLNLAGLYDVPATVFVSWIHSIAYVRNLCAHHGRIWNRYIPILPKIPDYKNHPEFHKPIPISTKGKKIFPTLVVIQYLLNFIDKKNVWGTRLASLMMDYEHLPLARLGFPENWQDISIWS